MAAVDYFLKLDGIEGESGDASHGKEIQVESFSWGANQSGASAFGGGGGAGKVAMQDFNFVMKVCKASPKLMLACATGEHIKTGNFTARKAGAKPMEFLKIKFTDLLVSSYQANGSETPNSPIPLDRVSLNFSKIEMEYFEQKPDGSAGPVTKAAFDLKQNTKA